MKKKLILLISVLCLHLLNSQAKELKYAVSDIPESLKQNAHTVYRVHDVELEIKSTRSATLKITEARTILNKNGEDDAYYNENSDPLNKITSVRARIYDATGKLVKTLGNADLQDHSAIAEFSLYDDNRVKYMDPKYLQYPFTVEYTSEMTLNQTLFLPSWSHGAENTAYEQSSFKVSTPLDYELRYKEYNIACKANKNVSDGQVIYTWALNNLKAQTDEPLSDSDNPDYPIVILAPKAFEIGNTKGSSETWKDLGLWTSNLISNKDYLPEATVKKIQTLTSDCKNDFEKVKKVYEFMQQKTRYVSIQIEIGGWVPIDAETVDKYSYGDCKALSNYTKALLKAAGIKAYYCRARAGSYTRQIDANFPSSQFNHAIVCVPLPSDTIWLECTSQRLPAGYNGDFTDDRDVLLIDGENSRLVHTRKYSENENAVTKKSIINILDANNGSMEVSAHYTGLPYEDILPIFCADNTDRNKRVSERIHIPSFTLNKCDYTEHKGRTPSFDEHLSITLTNPIKTVTSDIALLSLNIMNKLTHIPEKVRNRRTNFSIRRPEVESDTVVFNLPKSYEITELPAKSEILSKFGKYTAIVTKKDNNQIEYIRNLHLLKGRYLAEDYVAFREFLEEISSQDNAIASLKISK
ncbi:MAG: hypothetical protein RIS29_1955 [Bacteroidota bacterium]|jgi:transglutaminase-like putative cysteine protease